MVLFLVHARSASNIYEDSGRVRNVFMLRTRIVWNCGMISTMTPCMAVRFNGHIWLFEFKVVEMEPEGKALQQLKGKQYADKYRQYGEPIHLIGVEFSRESRNIVGFELEEA